MAVSNGGLRSADQKSSPKPSQRYWPTASSRGSRKFFAEINSSSRCLTLPSLAAEIDVSGHGFALRLAPVEGDLGGHGLLGRPDQPPVGRRQAHHVTQLRLRGVHVAQPQFDLGAELEVLHAGLGFLFRLAAAGAEQVQGVDLPPRLQRAVAAHLHRVQLAIGQVQVPVSLLDVADQALARRPRSRPRRCRY